MNWRYTAAFKNESNMFFKIFMFIYYVVNVRYNINIKAKLVFKKKRLIFTHLPKTGGSSVQKSLGSVIDVNLNHNLVGSREHDLFIPEGLRRVNFDLSPQDRVISIVRHPESLLLSYYDHVIGFDTHINRNHYDFDIAQLGIDHFVEEICFRTSKWPSSNFLYPQLLDMSGNRIVTHILRTEHLSNDINSLDIDETPIAIQHVRVSPNKSRQINESTKKLISSVYSREITLFYSKELNYENLRYDWRMDALFWNNKLMERKV